MRKDSVGRSYAHAPDYCLAGHVSSLNCDPGIAPGLPSTTGDLNVQNHERRSHAPPPSQAPEPRRTGRKGHRRLDVGRPEPVTRLDVLAELPQAARQDLRAALLGGTFMGAL